MAYLLEIEGVWTPTDKTEGPGSKLVPPALLEEVFALNEELDEIRENLLARMAWKAKDYEQAKQAFREHKPVIGNR